MARRRVIDDQTLLRFVADANLTHDPSTAEVARELGLAYRTAQDRLEQHPFLERMPCGCGRGVLWVASQ